MIRDILEFNQRFVKDGEALFFRTDKHPSRRLAILTCMDTRLTELLPAALGLKIGEAKTVRNAGGRIVSPYDDTVRSLLVAVAELGVREIMVIGHTDCGVCGMSWQTVRGHLLGRGVSQEDIKSALDQGVNFEDWFTGFRDAEAEIAASVKVLQNHPLMPPDVTVYGFVMDTETGELLPVSN